jgi:glutathionyl-hydroquinone reductase
MKMSKLTKEQKEEIRKRYQLYLNNTPQVIQKEYGLWDSEFRRIVSNNNRTATNIRNMIYATERRIKSGVCRDVKKAEKRIEDLRQQLAGLVNK